MTMCNFRCFSILLLFFIASCAPVPVTLNHYDNTAMEFADSLSKITNRYSGTEQIQRAEMYISQYMSGLGCVVTTNGETMQTSPHKSVTLYNIKCSFYPNYKKRVLLYSNYDQDPQSTDSSDCASGVALLMSLSGYIAENDPGFGIDIVFFDGRYATNNDSTVNVFLRQCLGSQAWVERNKKFLSNYDYGISVTHPAHKDAVFVIDGNSNHFASRHFYFSRSTAKLFGAESWFPDIIDTPYYGDNTIISTMGKVRSFCIVGQKSVNGVPFDIKNDYIQDVDNQRFEIIAKIILETLYTSH